MKEKIREQLLTEISRDCNDIIVAFVEENPQYVDTLVDFVLLNENKLSMRAAWALDHINSNGKIDLQPAVNRLIPHYGKLTEQGAKRCVSKLLMTNKISEEYEGEVLDICLSAIEDPKQAVAVKANCMTVIFNLLPKYPELKSEVFAIIEDQIPHNSIGFGSRFNVLKRRLK